MARYNKVPRLLWSGGLSRLPPPPCTPATLYLYLMTCERPSCVAGLLRLGIGAIVDETRWDYDAVESGLADLVRAELITRHTSPPVIFVHEAMDADKPRGPKQEKGWRRALDEWPDCPPVRLARGTAFPSDTLSDTLSGTLSDTPSIPVAGSGLAPRAREDGFTSLLPPSEPFRRNSISRLSALLFPQGGRYATAIQHRALQADLDANGDEEIAEAVRRVESGSWSNSWSGWRAQFDKVHRLKAEASSRRNGSRRSRPPAEIDFAPDPEEEKPKHEPTIWDIRGDLEHARKAEWKKARTWPSWEDWLPERARLYADNDVGFTEEEAVALSQKPSRWDYNRERCNKGAEA